MWTQRNECSSELLAIDFDSGASWAVLRTPTLGRYLTNTIHQRQGICLWLRACVHVCLCVCECVGVRMQRCICLSVSWCGSLKWCKTNKAGIFKHFWPFWTYSVITAGKKGIIDPVEMSEYKTQPAYSLNNSWLTSTAVSIPNYPTYLWCQESCEGDKEGKCKCKTSHDRMWQWADISPLPVVSPSTLSTILISLLIPTLPDSTVITVTLQTYRIGRIETNTLFISHTNLGLLCCL